MNILASFFTVCDSKKNTGIGPLSIPDVAKREPTVPKWFSPSKVKKKQQNKTKKSTFIAPFLINVFSLENIYEYIYTPGLLQC